MLKSQPKTSVYIDAFNLYFGALRKTPYRWLDLEALCRIYLPNNEVTCIKYFTAKVSARLNDPQKQASRAILRHIDFIKQIRASALALCQFPRTLSDSHGSFTKPDKW